MKKLLLTRLPEDNEEDRRYFEQRGFQCVQLPLMQLTPRQPVEDSVIEQLQAADWIFLTSQHSASFFVELVRTNLPASFFEEKKFAVIGEQTAAVLKYWGIRVDFQAQTPLKEKLFEEWSATQVCQGACAKIVYPKSSLADDRGEQLLTTAGHKLFTFVLYDNQLPVEAVQKLKAFLGDSILSAVYFTSPSLWQRFYAVYQQLSYQPDLSFFCVGRTTQQLIEQAGFNAELK